MTFFGRSNILRPHIPMLDSPFWCRSRAQLPTPTEQALHREEWWEAAEKTKSWSIPKSSKLRPPPGQPSRQPARTRPARPRRAAVDKEWVFLHSYRRRQKWKTIERLQIEGGYVACDAELVPVCRWVWHGGHDYYWLGGVVWALLALEKRERENELIWSISSYNWVSEKRHAHTGAQMELMESHTHTHIQFQSIFSMLYQMMFCQYEPTSTKVTDDQFSPLL